MWVSRNKAASYALYHHSGLGVMSHLGDGEMVWAQAWVGTEKWPLSLRAKGETCWGPSGPGGLADGPHLEKDVSQA